MKSKGKEGEDLAAQFLQEKGYVLIERNYRSKRGEIDLIVMKDDLLCFIEVKLRSRDDFGEPETFVSENQKGIILETAEHYIYEKDWQQDIRFDIVAIKKTPTELAVDHFEDAFY